MVRHPGAKASRIVRSGYKTAIGERYRAEKTRAAPGLSWRAHGEAPQPHLARRSCPPFPSGFTYHLLRFGWEETGASSIDCFSFSLKKVGINENRMAGGWTWKFRRVAWIDISVSSRMDMGKTWWVGSIDRSNSSSRSPCAPFAGKRLFPSSYQLAAAKIRHKDRCRREDTRSVATMVEVKTCMPSEFVAAAEVRLASGRPGLACFVSAGAVATRFAEGATGKVEA